MSRNSGIKSNLGVVLFFGFHFLVCFSPFCFFCIFFYFFFNCSCLVIILLCIFFFFVIFSGLSLIVWRRPIYFLYCFHLVNRRKISRGEMDSRKCE